MSFISDLKAYLARIFFNSTDSNTQNNDLVTEPRTCKYLLDNSTSSTLTLPDGRKLGYAQWGSPTGRAILFLHGLPGSRIEATMLHEMGLELGARIIAADRPGFGWSSPHPGRALLDFPKDLEYLTEYLGIETYSVMGVSGGGPYALTCAFALPRSKLKCVSIICGLGPPDIGMSGADWAHWSAFPYGFRYSPVWLLRWVFRGEPAARLEWSDEKRFEMHMKNAAALTDERDRAAFLDADFAQVILRGAKENYAQGFEALSQDGRLMCSDWGFRVEDIRKDLPVHLWYGKRDVFVPIVHGYQIAARLGGRAKLRVVDESHGSIWVNCREEALRELVKCS